MSYGTTDWKLKNKKGADMLNFMVADSETHKQSSCNDRN